MMLLTGKSYAVNGVWRGDDVMRYLRRIRLSDQGNARGLHLCERTRRARRRRCHRFCHWTRRDDADSPRFRGRGELTPRDIHAGQTITHLHADPTSATCDMIRSPHLTCMFTQKVSDLSRDRVRCRGIHAYSVDKREGGPMAGTIRKRGKSWQALLSVVDVDTHKSVQFSVTKRTRKEAESALAELVQRRDKRQLARHNETFAMLAEEWLTQIESSSSRSPTSIDQYRQRLAENGRIMRELGAVKVGEMTTRHIDRFTAATSHLAANTRLSDLATISAVCSMGVRWGMMLTNPVTNATRPRRPKTSINLPDVEQRTRLLEVADQHGRFEGTLIRLAIVTGARHGELAGLRWGDVSWTTGEISVSRIITLHGAVKLPKGEKTRTVEVGVDMLAWLKLRREDQMLLWREEYGGQTVTDDTYVFMTKPIVKPAGVYEQLGTRWRRVRDAAGLPDMRLHDCRHLAATVMLHSHMPLRAVSERLGHANPNITLGVYAQLMPGDDRVAAEVMDAFLRGDTPDV